ncbi:hypothetical protein STCU_12299 [Strigomonas culicis]|uniref:Uncharacterized protein n=1 Tax=Strigomonas culicis TaxID=28005 RepID=S9UKJ5_9TRYP|nr:hypothetical protein STCU_12299 [Strigomonas culicis]|eukprot:EPY15161.1 hypothetical protein STCU_12299 [Strigomonas culicis]
MNRNTNNNHKEENHFERYSSLEHRGFHFVFGCTTHAHGTLQRQTIIIPKKKTTVTTTTIPTSHEQLLWCV